MWFMYVTRNMVSTPRLTSDFFFFFLSFLGSPTTASITAALGAPGSGEAGSEPLDEDICCVMVGVVVDRDHVLTPPLVARIDHRRPLNKVSLSRRCQVRIQRAHATLARQWKAGSTGAAGRRLPAPVRLRIADRATIPYRRWGWREACLVAGCVYVRLP